MRNIIRTVTTIAALATIPACSSADSGGSLDRLMELVVVLSIALMSVALVAVMCSLVLQILRSSPGTHAIESSSWQNTFFSATVALFGILIAGLFVFMSFRIDREAREAAERVASDVAAAAANKALQGFTDLAAERLLVGTKRVQEIAAQIAEGSSRRVPEDSQIVQIGQLTQFIADGQGRTWFRFEVGPEQDQTYRIDAEGGETNTNDIMFVDPIVYLYELDRGDDQNIDLIRLVSENDDGGDGFNARLEMDLDAGVYYFGIGTFAELGGAVNVLVSTVGTGAN